MFKELVKKINRFLYTERTPEEKFKQYLKFAYPSNHVYRLSRGKLKPNYKLASRYQKIRQLFPENLTSLADIGCSKGYFVFSASSMNGCERSLGIDVHQEDIHVCRWVKENLDNHRVQFEKMRLHELAESIDQFGGPFQTVLLLNTYQYLYFGSDGHPECYLDHDFIFSHLKKICSGRVIFNNRVTYEDCQRQVKRYSYSECHRENYMPEKIFTAAEKYFKIKEYGTIGKYPLIALDVKTLTPSPSPLAKSAPGEGRFI